jgi:hypothetical protein
LLYEVGIINLINFYSKKTKFKYPKSMHVVVNSCSKNLCRGTKNKPKVTPYLNDKGALEEAYWHLPEW